MSVPTDEAAKRMEDLEWLKSFCADNYYSHPRLISGDRYAAIAPHITTYSILIGDLYDETSISERYCYHTEHSAVAALAEWDGDEGTEPQSWHRHLPSNRRLAERKGLRDQDGNEPAVGTYYVYP